MATKIFYNNSRIIIDGHADTPEECQAITAMCDSLANDERFKTIVYEKGHAVFERVDGGDAMMFAMQKYVLTSRYNDETGYDATELAAKGTIKKRLDDLERELDYELDETTEDTLAYRISKLVESESKIIGAINMAAKRLGARLSDDPSLDPYLTPGEGVIPQLEDFESRLNALESIAASLNLLTNRVTALENKSSKTLPYTADELIEKLESI